MDRYLVRARRSTPRSSSRTWRRPSRGAASTPCSSPPARGVGMPELLELITAGVPLPARAPAAGGHHASTASRSPGITCDPDGPAGRRGRQDHQRPLRRPDQPGPRLLRHAAPRHDRARLRARPGRPRARGPRRRRAHRRAHLARWASSSAPSPSAWPATSARWPSCPAPRPATRSPTRTGRC